jgi:hypothetical protein
MPSKERDVMQLKVWILKGVKETYAVSSENQIKPSKVFRGKHVKC